MSKYPPLRLCGPCSQRQCEQRGPECDDTNVCQCPCALSETPEELADFARDLRSVPAPWKESTR
jgi:hypothetical protein